MAVRNSRRTHRLAGATAETLGDVPVDTLALGWQRSLEQRPHEDDSTARTVVLVLEREIRWTRLETETAVHARIDPRALAGEWTVGQSALGRYDDRRAHERSPKMP